MKLLTAFAFTLGLGINILAIASAQAMRISTVSISAQFEDNGTIYHYSNDVPVGTSNGNLPFCNTGNMEDCRDVPFSVEYLGTTLEGNGQFYSDEVKISYSTLSGTDFLGKEALFDFDGKDNQNNVLPIDAVINYTMAGLLNRGYILNTNVFPANIVGFYSQQGNLVPGTNGAPNSAFFTLNYSYVPEPLPAPPGGKTSFYRGVLDVPSDGMSYKFTNPAIAGVPDFITLGEVSPNLIDNTFTTDYDGDLFRIAVGNNAILGTYQGTFSIVREQVSLTTLQGEAFLSQSQTLTFPFEVQVVPEPLTILGAGTAAGFGAFFKRELNKKKKEQKNSEES